MKKSKLYYVFHGCRPIVRPKLERIDFFLLDTFIIFNLIHQFIFTPFPFEWQVTFNPYSYICYNFGICKN
ncbi:MAG: hypothetical protein LBF00_03215 [Mycoplasmataceae bacterium]|nr:hypothetical protein [Mycoplasmataceae bacterium]